MRPVLIAALAAASAWAQSAGGTLRFCLRADPKTFDPHTAVDEPSEYVRYMTGGVLVRVNRSTQQVEGALAKSWKVSEGGKRVTFQLRDGLRFSDGSPLTPDDVVYSVRRVLDPAVKSPLASSFRIDASTARVETKGATEVSVVFPAPVAGLPRDFDSLVIVPAKATAKEKATAGPFFVKEHKAGQYVALERNPHYWKKDSGGRRLPMVDSVRLDIQPNREIEMMRFLRGELHMIARVEPDLYERLVESQPKAVRDGGVSLESEMLWFNQAPGSPVPAHKKAWFTRTEFRQAIAEAINREDICRILYKGRAHPASGPVSAANKLWHNGSVKAPRYDPKAAREKLLKLGFTDRGGQLHDAAGNAVAFSIVTNTNKTRERMAAMVQQDLAKIGIKVTITALDFPSLIDRMTKSFNYEACMLVLTNVDLDPNGQMNVLLSSASTHQWNPSQKTPATPWEAEIDRLMRAQAASANQGERKQLFDKVQKIMAEQQPFIYLVTRHALTAAGPGVGNFKAAQLHPSAFWNIDELYLMQGGATVSSTGDGGQ